MNTLPRSLCRSLTPATVAMAVLLLAACGGGGGGSSGGGGGDAPSVAARTVTIAPGDGECPAGGVFVETGIDENRNGRLDAAEVDERVKVCNGVTGQSALVALSDEAPGDHCSAGGIRIDSGIDDDGDGTLGPAEIDASRYLCNGEPGPAGENWWDVLGATGAVAGRVVLEDGRAARNAMLRITGTPHYAFTDTTGHYRFERVAVGRRRLDVTLEGYLPGRIDPLPVTEGTTLQARTLRLYRKRDPLPARFPLAGAKAFSGLRANGQSGLAVSIVGDVNGDGLDDILIGAGDTGGVSAAGGGYLVYGRPGLDLDASLADLQVSADVVFLGASVMEHSGSAVAAAGDVNGDGFADLLIGAYLASPGGVVRSGQSYLVYGGPALPASFDLASADVVFTGVAADDFSGRALAGIGDVNGDGYDDILIGAPGADPGGLTDAGEAYLVYGGPALVGKISLASADARFTGMAVGDGAGSAVSGAGDIDGDGRADLLIGAPQADSASGTDSGKAYLFFGFSPPAGTLALDDASVVLSGGQGGDWVGYALASAGDIDGDGHDDILIGAPTASPGGVFAAGAAYLIHGSATMPTEIDLAGVEYDLVKGVLFSGRVSGDWAGASVSGVGDVNGDGFDDLLIGTHYGNATVPTSAGESYLLYGGASLGHHIPLASADVTFAGIARRDWSGRAIGGGDINGDGFDDLLFGAEGADAGGVADSGAVYLVMGRASGTAGPVNRWHGSHPLARADLRMAGGEAVEISGLAVASAGDVNGDGYDDVLIGAHRGDTAAGADAGITYLIYGRPGFDRMRLLEREADVLFTGVAAGDESGWSVAGAGDVNGDGYDDILIGARNADPGRQTNAGETYLILGRPDLPRAFPLTLADARFTGTTAGNNSGWVVVGAGDLDGDGYADIAIGAPFAGRGGTAYLFWGGPGLTGSHVLSDAPVRFNGIIAGGQAGASIAGVGDVDGDGRDDLLIGAYRAAPNGLIDAGESYLFSGVAISDGSHLLSAATAIFQGVMENDRSGSSLAAAGDVNGDGYGDILIGAVSATVGTSLQVGSAYLIHGGLSLTGTLSLADADATFTSIDSIGGSAGCAVAGLGDIDGDGYDDLLIGDNKADPGGLSNAGEAYLFHGSARLTGTLSLADADARFTGGSPNDLAATALAGAGDFNGDGLNDLLIGAHNADPVGRTNAGETYLLLGRGRRPLE